VTVRRILMVCTANICRSPTAEGVLRDRLVQRGLDATVQVDSAGTHASTSQSLPPDPRSVAHAARRGYDLSAVRARRISAADFEGFDLILAMDEDNLANLRSACPPAHRHKIELLMAYAPERAPRVVPDPYYGGAAGFEWVLDLIELACDSLAAHLHSPQGHPPA
jgi:protein-tyrosine phosphatase